jgi:type IV secretory pathway protease TraF
MDQNLEKQLEQFLTKKIVVPYGMRQIVRSRDSVVLNTNSEVARFVVYTDSLSCSSCRLKMMSDYYFVRGDNVMNSGDSRYWGFVPEEFIVGVARRIAYSRDRHTDEFRWNRLWRRIHGDLRE